MRKAKAAPQASDARRTRRRSWYFPLLGMIAGAVVVVVAYLPSDSPWIAGVVVATLSVVSTRLISRIVNAPASPRQYCWKIVWLIAVGIVLLGGVLVASTVGHVGGAIWLSWVVGALLSLAVSTGTWVLDARPQNGPADDA